LAFWPQYGWQKIINHGKECNVIFALFHLIRNDFIFESRNLPRIPKAEWLKGDSKKRLILSIFGLSLYCPSDFLSLHSKFSLNGNLPYYNHFSKTLFMQLFIGEKGLVEIDFADT